MTLWRVSNHAALDGAGGLRTPGRWHSRGAPIVYCAPNPATALLEILVHAEIDAGDVPVTFRFLEIEAPEPVSIATLSRRELGPDWPDNVEATRRVGDAWLQSRSSALLGVPSVLVPATWNVLLNPRHPDAKHVKVVRRHQHPADPRLWM